MRTRTDLHPYAAKPLQHLAKSLEPLGLDCQVTWNTLRLDMPDTHGMFLDKGAPPVICMETPLMGRHLWQFDGSADPENVYYRLALHDPSVIYGGFRFFRDKRRLDGMFRRFGYEVKPWRKDRAGNHVLFALQVPGDTSLKGINVLEAAVWDLFELKRQTNRPIVVSIHPDCWREGWAAERLGNNREALRTLVDACNRMGVRTLDSSERTADFFDGAHCIVTYTSGTSFEALLAGVPSIALHRGSFQTALSDRSLALVENPIKPSTRECEWERLAHIQYSWAEIGRGEHLETIEELLKE